jgi:HEAT repeat protein
VAVEAIHCLWAIERQPDRAVEAARHRLRTVVEGSRQQQIVTRAKAIYILGEIGPEAKAAEPDLLILLKDDPESTIRMYTAQALGKIGRDTKIREALKAATVDRDPDVCQAANEALKRLGPS